MRIAIVSDIHANLPAFEEVLKDIDRREVDAVYCLGDLVGYNVWPNAVIREIRKRHIVTIAGNHDEKAVEAAQQKGEVTPDNFAYKIIGKEELCYLSTLPAHIRLEYIFNGRPLVMLLVHGSPFSNTEYLLEEKDEAEYARMLLQVGADILVCGHSHKPYHKILNAVSADKKFLHAINAGSVGKPKDADPRACYCIVTLGESSNNLKKSGIEVEFVRISYNVERAITAIEESILHPILGDMLRKAY